MKKIIEWIWWTYVATNRERFALLKERLAVLEGK